MKKCFYQILALVLAAAMTLPCYGASANVQPAGKSRFGQLAVGFWDTILLHPDGTVTATSQEGSEKVQLWKDISRIQFDDGWAAYGVTNQGSVLVTDPEIQSQLSDWKNIADIAVSLSVDYERFILGLRKDGTVITRLPEGFNLKGISDWKDITAIAAGDRHAVGLMKDGRVVAAGANDYGQCNVSGWRNVIAVAAGKNLTVGLQADGKVLTVGDIPSHEKELVARWGDISSVTVSHGSNIIGLRKDGNLEWSQFVLSEDIIFEGWDVMPANWKNIDSIYGGPCGAAAFCRDGSVLIMGSMQTGTTIACKLTDHTQQHLYRWDEKDAQRVVCDICGKAAALPQQSDSAGRADCEHYWTSYPYSVCPQESYDDHFMGLLKKASYFCVNCGKTREYSSAEVTSLPVLRDTNSKKKKDIVFGNWAAKGDDREFNDSLRFWVMKQEGYSNTESIDYDLGGKYEALIYEAAVEKSSKSGADIAFTIYGDGKPLQTIKATDYGDLYYVNVKDIQTLRISCTNKTAANGYGVFWGVLFEPMDFE